MQHGTSSPFPESSRSIAGWHFWCHRYSKMPNILKCKVNLKIFCIYIFNNTFVLFVWLFYMYPYCIHSFQSFLSCWLSLCCWPAVSCCWSIWHDTITAAEWSSGVWSVHKIQTWVILKATTWNHQASLHEVKKSCYTVEKTCSVYLP